MAQFSSSSRCQKCREVTIQSSRKRPKPIALINQREPRGLPGFTPQDGRIAGVCRSTTHLKLFFNKPKQNDSFIKRPLKQCNTQT
jgi:hypothetical protein